MFLVTFVGPWALVGLLVAAGLNIGTALAAMLGTVLVLLQIAFFVSGFHHWQRNRRR
jgi:hypothetical protein